MDTSYALLRSFAPGRRTHRLVAAGLVLAALFAAALGFARPAYAAGITVTTTADTLDAAGGSCTAITLAALPGPDGQVSLREAVCAANTNAGPDTITFSVNGTFALTGAANEDNGGAGDLDIKQSLAVNGNGVANTIIDGSGIERIFDVFPSAASTFDISNLTLQNGDTRATSFKEGGAIYLHNNVTTTINNSQIVNNFSGANGAIENRGTLTINDSVISNNQTIPTSGSVTGGGLHNAGPLTINNTTISNNSVRGEGGGIFITVASGVTANITNSTISGNTASVTGGGLGNGGGISTTGNQGTISITNSTISGNRADNTGGGAYWVTPGGSTGNVTLTNVTISNNTADYDNNGAGAGGGFAQSVSAVTLRNTLVAGNFNSTSVVRDDISGAAVASSAYNLIGDGTGSSGLVNGVNNNQVGSGASPINPLLGALANNGGPTETHALLGGSPAINTGNNAVCPATDQRGVARPSAGICDIGSFELDLLVTTTSISLVTPEPSVVGETVTIQFSVTSGAGTPTGNVTVTDGVVSCAASVAAGQCSITFTSAGARNLTATYAGDGTFAGSSSAVVAHQVNPADTTVTITDDLPDPSVVGAPVVVIYSLTVDAPGSGTVPGVVTVSDGVDTCTGTIAGGQCTIFLTTAGARTLTAVYGGNADFNGSTSDFVPHTVLDTTTTTAITSDVPDPSVVGQSVTIQYSVSSGGGTPTGNVTVSDGTQSCTGTVAGGQCSITFTSAGGKSLTATYAGDGTFAGSSSPAEAHQVDQAGTTTTITSDSPDPSQPGAAVTVNYNVAVNAPGAGTPTGNVTVSDGVDSCTGTVAAGTCSITLTTPGARTLTATYAGDSNYTGSASAGEPHTVGTPTTTTILSDNPDPSVVGQAVTVQYSVAPISGGGTPTGNVTVSDGTISCTGTVAAGQCSLTFTTAGTKSLTATYAGDGLYNGSTSAAESHQVKATTTLLYNGGQIVNIGSSFTPAALLSSSTAACTTGQTISFSLDANPLTGAAGTYALGTATTGAGGQATMAPIGTTGWLEGVYTINATFAGTAACDTSSDSATLTVAGPGDSANGGGWYTLSGSGRINFGFTVSKVDNKCTSNCAYKGQLLLINNGKWRLKGNLTAYSKTSNGQGAAGGTGDLFWWDASLNAGAGDWALAQSGVSYTANFYDSGKNGKASTDSFGIRIVYTPVGAQPNKLPNSTPQLLKGGNITVK